MPGDTHTREWEDHLQAVIADGDAPTVRELLEDVPPPDLAEYIVDLEEPERGALLAILSDEQVADLLAELDAPEQGFILTLLSPQRLADILDEMPSDDAADLLAELPEAEQDALLEEMEPEQAEDVAALLMYPEDSAGGLMAVEFVRVGPDDTVAQVLELLRTHHDDAEMIYTLFVLDEEERLLGEVSLRQLVVAGPEATMADLMRREFVSVTPETPQEEVVELVRRHNLLALPVLAHDGAMLGFITVDDVGEVVQESAADDLMSAGGSEEPAQPDATPWWARRGWRTGLVTLIGAVAVALALLIGKGVLLAHPTLAWLTPCFLLLGLTGAGQAVNAMDQSFDSALERRVAGRMYRRELLVGLLPALVGAVLAGVFAFVRSLRMASAAGTALGNASDAAFPMLLAVWVASAAGTTGVALIRGRGADLVPALQTAVTAGALFLGTIVYLLAGTI